MRRINETLAIPERNSRGFGKPPILSNAIMYVHTKEKKNLKRNACTRKKERMKNHNTHTTHAGIKHDAFVSFAYVISLHTCASAVII